MVGSGHVSTPGKENEMPKRRAFAESNTYIVLYYHEGRPDIATFIGAKAAVDGYRFFQSIYGPSTQLLKVVINCGEKV